jgi:hypothetical protein
MDLLLSTIQNSLLPTSNTAATNTTTGLTTTGLTTTGLTTDANNLLSKQMAANNNFNDFLNNASQMVNCGPGSECQKKEVTSSLEKKYLDAKLNVDVAPLQLETAKKNYYIYKDGRHSYNGMIEKELTQKAETITNVITEKFNEEIENANIMNSYYNTIQNNSENTIELYNEYLKKNKDLNALIKASHGDVLTNDRKTYYETEAIDRLNMWNTFFLSVYYILVAAFCLAMFFSPNNFSLPKKLVFIFLLIVYPFVIHKIVVPIYKYMNTSIKNTETNVYLNL